MKTKWSLALVAACAVLVGGCGSAPQPIDQKYMTSGAKLGQDVHAMYVRTGGDYSKLTPAEREEYVKSFNGKEDLAKNFWDGIKNGPGARPGSAH